MAERAPLHGSALVLVTLAMGLGAFMQVLDTSIANVSIPAIAGDLAVSPDQGTWVITSFAVSNAIVLPITGWLAKRVGEVRLFILSTLAFSIASWLCGLAPNLPLLVFFRVLQGAVAGPMIPMSQTLLLSNYPPHKRGMALALWSMTVVTAPIFGPILGGWITDNISWPWIFYINIPVGMFSAYLTWQLLRHRETEIVRRPVDIVGLALLAIGIGSLQVLLDKGNDLDWFGSTTIDALAVVAAVALSYFVVWELTEKHPVVDLHLFSRRNFAVGTLTLSLGYLTFFGNVVVFPLWLQTQMGYTATWAGLAAAPIGLLSIVFSPIVGRNLHKFDLRILTSVAFLVFAVVSFWASGFDTSVSYAELVAPRLVQGIGMAFFFVPLVSITLSGIPGEQVASASGISNFARILAGSFGTSLSITLWTRRAQFHQAMLTDPLTPYSPVATQALNLLHERGLSSAGALAVLARTLVQQAVMLATNDVLWLSGCIFLALLAAVWLARPPFMVGGGAGSDAH
ncbi:MAG: DHA2 family efflux MFS transporter permease subunit [Betaproteobacteria bacterium]|nr:DHA2 family efflux MFS transporter permease subunit [Betaproteobacteria bacterium]